MIWPDERPWRNITPPVPLPPEHSDRFCWRPLVEIALGPEPQRPAAWANLPDVEPLRGTANE
jgi:hypothetical protein